MPEDKDISLLVTVPVCSFRKGYAREYLETEDIPPPSTIYGFLLSLAGEEIRDKYLGTNIAYAILREPEKSVVIRTTWRMKIRTLPTGIGNNRSPDFQEILTGLQLAVWIQNGPLAERISIVRSAPWKIDRYGGLCLGESRDLVNDVQWFPKWTRDDALWVVPDPDGDLPLPIWVDHVGAKNTVWKQFCLSRKHLNSPGEHDPRWISIVNTAE